MKTNSPTDLGTAHCRNHAHGMWVDYRTVRAALRQRTVLIVCNTRGNHADSRHIHRLWSASGEYCVVGGVIDDERQRSEGLKRAGVDVIVRIRMDDLHDLEGLKQRLEGADVPLRRR
ncbi:hypothetical protein PG2029B_0373 [Bifidobacterium pseudolongum subsp. globosum]|uniref:Uncharacterized protein n=1 Tax=Bifidobacterium pseudolongum subsp. globosum TaxID=1690 RepID=A0A4V1Y3G3_9BIFI|nr:hypothetical protein [Bifidobacterium pseudolongum]RYQ27329.1 hypothetical protein PG2032B_0373 [Bifidobacterium pseudolongum subsp. globosum]RYQ27768.1 hypothetical protein PG2029B_0373 [Bifidobacterium pseudolongum subsp. globosum]